MSRPPAPRHGEVGRVCARFSSVMGQSRANVAWRSPYSSMRLSLHPPLSTPSVSGMRERGSKKKKRKKDDILAVVADLHRPFGFSAAHKTATKDTRPKRPGSKAAIHTAQTFSSSVRRNLISYGWSTPSPRRAGQVNAPHTFPPYPRQRKRHRKSQLTWFQNRFMVATWLWLILMWEKQLQRRVPPLCVAGRREGKARGADVNE